MSIKSQETTKVQQEIVRAIPGVKILGTGSYVPDNVVKNEDLEQLGCDADWIIKRTGIAARRHVVEGQASSDLAIQAAKSCLKDAGVDASEVDLILVATMTPDHFTPSTACLVQAALGCKCGAIDLNAACTGFLYALITGAQFIKTGASRRTLVIASEAMSAVVDPEDKKTYPLFGDGAAAVLLGSNPNPAAEGCSGILGFRLMSEGELSENLVIPGCGSRHPANQKVIDDRMQFLQMEGRTVFKWAVRLIPELVDDVLKIANMSLDQIDLVILHQANARIIGAAAENLNIDPKRIFSNIDRYGNTSAASVPISIHEARTEGLIQPGSHVLLAGFGAGLTWGSCILRW